MYWPKVSDKKIQELESLKLKELHKNMNIKELKE